jgi:hypothetical protein
MGNWGLRHYPLRLPVTQYQPEELEFQRKNLVLFGIQTRDVWLRSQHCYQFSHLGKVCSHKMTRNDSKIE